MLSKGLGVHENLSYKEFFVEILDRQVKRLKYKEVASVRVLRGNNLIKGETYVNEDNMRSFYPHLISYWGRYTPP